MEENKDPNPNQITNKDLFKDFLAAVTDFEKRLFKTFKELCFTPEKVILAYIGGHKNEYFSVFRYLLLSVFISYLSNEFFLHPGEIGGAYYKSAIDSLQSSIALMPAKNNEITQINFENFNIFYLEFSRLLNSFFKAVI